MGLDKHIYFLGFVSPQELAWLYRNSSCLSFFSIGGPNNYPPIEAISLGCPIVVSDIEGHRQQLGAAALYASPMDPAAWAEQLSKVIADSQEVRATLDEGKTLISNLSVDIYLGKVFDTIESIIKYRRLWS